MNMDLIITVAAIAMAYCGYRIGFEAGMVEERHRRKQYDKQKMAEQFQAKR